MRKMILASASPRRREILSSAGYDFDIMVSDVDETVEGLGSKEMVKELSKRKAVAVAQKILKSDDYNDFLVIGADTLVFVDDTPMGKPESPAMEEDFLKKMSGRSHKVITGVTLCYNEGSKLITDSFAEATLVHVASLDKEEIAWYINTKEWTDKAGGYAIQGYFAKFITGIEGEYENVVGFPLASFYQEIKRMELL